MSILNILKDAIDTYIPILTKVINSSIQQNQFSNELKLADVLPIHKKKTLWKRKLLPVRYLSSMCIKQSSKLSGLHNIAQHCLIYMPEKRKNTLDKGKHVGAISMDFSKAFDTMNNGLLVAKLEAYRFASNTLLLVLN